MDQKKILKQLLEFQNVTFNNAFDANALLQDQLELMTSTVMDQASWLPPEGRKAFDSWVGMYKSSRDNLKKYVNENYKQADHFFSE
jgi:hypothetical protein